MNYKILIALVAGVFLLDGLWRLFQNRKRNELLRQLDECLNRKDFKTFDGLIESRPARTLFPAYNRAYLKLNEAMYKEDRAEIDKAFASFDMPMNKAQKTALYKKGFYYYLGLEDRGKTDHYFELLKQLDVSDRHSLDVMYDIYIDKGYKYIGEMEERIKGLTEEEQMPFLALLSDMYRNKGDQKKAEEFRKKVKDFTGKIRG